MSQKTVEHLFTGDTVKYTAYDSAKTILGDLIQQRTGVAATDKYAGPMPIGIARPMEASTAIAVAYPHVISYNDNVDWVFLAENSAGAATRRIVLYEHDKTNSVFTWKGFITLTFPIATVHTIRGFRMIRELYTTGTASVSGTTVTGSSSAWSTSRMTVGSRIGFGSSDPTQITTWYEISAVGSDNSITLTTSAGTISSGPYVIEDLKCVVSTTNATAANGGLFMAMGLRYENFSVGGTTIAAGVTTDLIRAVYWLSDAGTVTNTIACGLALGNRDSWTQQYVYVIDGTTTTCRVYKYNFRAALAGLAAGKSNSAFVLVTGAQTPVGTLPQANNGRVGTLSHGPGNGVESLYFVAPTRVYRAALTNITSGNTTWQSDAMVEVPPGGTATFAATGLMNAVEISGNIDRLIINSTGAAGVRSYVTKYNTNSDPFDHIFLNDDKQQDQSTADANTYPHPAMLVNAFSAWSEDGIGYFCRNGITVANNHVYSVPIGSHWSYASGTPNQRLMTPSLATPNSVSLLRVYVNFARTLGNEPFAVSPEPYRLFYRTTGITDNTGGWTAVDSSGTLSNAVAGSEIQFMFEFKILGLTCIPARIHGLTLVYEDNTTDSHYQPSAGKSSIASKQFAWRFSTAFNSTVPTLRVRLYDAVTGGLLVDDNTASPTGTFEKSTNDGSSWTSYNTTDKANNTTYIRYTPASLGDNIKVRALLTLNS